MFFPDLCLRCNSKLTVRMYYALNYGSIRCGDCSNYFIECMRSYIKETIMFHSFKISNILDEECTKSYIDFYLISNTDQINRIFIGNKRTDPCIDFETIQKYTMLL